MSLEAPPGPRGRPLVGVLPRIWRDPLGFFTEVAADYGGITKFGNRKFTLYLLSDPAAIQHVLVDNAKNYWKGEGLAAAKTVMGSGLATSTGSLWARQRKLMQPMFTRPSVAELGPAMQSAADDLESRWREGGGAPRDVLPDASRFVHDAMFRSLFGQSIASVDTLELDRALAVANEFIHRSAWSMVKPPAWMPTPLRVRFRRAMRALDGFVYRMIAERRRQPSPEPDVLGRLLDARDPETGEAMSDEQVRDEIMTLFVAGHDTTMAAVAWTLWALGDAPDWVEKIHDELVAEPDTPLSQRDLLGRAVQESLRVYPPSWLFVRTPHEADTILGYRVPKAAPLLISPYVVHRSPKVWDDPLRFDPDRFLPERIGAMPRFAYLPYAGGARNCIGMHFADQALRLAMLTAVRSFRIEREPDTVVEAEPRTTLQPKGRVPMRLVPRA